MSTVSNLLGGIYEYLGRPSQDKLNLGAVLPFLLDAIDFYLIDLQSSSENWLVKSHIYTPKAKEEPVEAPEFDVPVAVEIRDPNSTSEADWTPILISNLSDLQDIGRDGTPAIAFYGTPTRSALSWDPIVRPVVVKLWYEPLATQPVSLTDSPQLSQAFHSMLKVRTALMCLPFVAPDNSALRDALVASLQQWEQKWQFYNNVDRNARAVQKRDYRGVRRRRDSDTGGWWI